MDLYNEEKGGLFRQVMKHNTMAAAFKHTGYEDRSSERREKKCTADDPELSPQIKYINLILKQWATDPEPEHLFQPKRWKKWIRHVAQKLNEPEKFSNPDTLDTYANTLITMFCDVNFSFLHNASMSLDENQKSILYTMKDIREDKEDEMLAREASNNNLGGFNRIGIDVSEDVIIVEDSCNLPLKLSNANSGSPICSSNGSPDRIFSEFDTHFSKGRRDCHFNSSHKYSRFTNGETLSRKRNRKTDAHIPSSVHNSDRKKYRSENNQYFKPLNVKKVPRKPICTGEDDNAQYYHALGRLSEPKPCNARCVEKENDLKSFEFDECYENLTCDDDVIIENPTPPCSPAGTNSETDNCRSKNDDSFRNVNTSCVSPTATSPVYRRDLFYNTSAKLKDGDSRIAQNKKIKGIRLRPSSNEQFTDTINSKIIEEDFELPDIEPVETIEQDKENYPVSADEIAVKYPKPPTAPALTLEIFETLKTVLDKPPKQKIVLGFSLYILQEDLAIFNKDTEWLNDRNIDFYLEIIRERSTKGGFPRVYIFHSFFYALLTGKDGGYEIVQETTGEDDIFKYDIVFFPVNLNQHWRLVVVKFQEKSLKCYDSMRHDNSEILRNIGQYLRKEYHRKHRNYPEDPLRGYVSEDDRMSPVSFQISGEKVKTRMFFDSNSWIVENVSSETIPQQKNAIDCGIFVLQYAEYLSRATDFDFDQSHIPYFRKRMMFETLTKQILAPVGNENVGKI